MPTAKTKLMRNFVKCTRTAIEDLLLVWKLATSNVMAVMKPVLLMVSNV